MASGNNATLFDHHTDDIGTTLDPAQAARILVAAQSFSLAGPCNPKLKLYFTDGACARGRIFYVKGKSLFETLLLNLLRYTDSSPLNRQSDDCPAWEMDDPFAHQRSIPRGYLDYLTWQNRRILLLPENGDGEIIIKQYTAAPGLSLDAELISGGMLLDPMKHYRKDEKRGYLVLRFNEGKALWRDSAALFQLHTPEQGRPPLAFNWLAELVDNAYLDKAQTLQCMALGMANNQAKVEFYREDHMPLPLAYLKNQERVEDLSAALKLSQIVRNKIWGAARRMAMLILSPHAEQEGGRNPDPKDVANLTDHWGLERNYWGDLEIPFLALLESLPKDPETAIENWRDKLWQTAWKTFTQAEALAGDDTRALRAAVRARRQLASGLKDVLSDEIAA